MSEELSGVRGWLPFSDTHHLPAFLGHYQKTPPNGLQAGKKKPSYRREHTCLTPKLGLDDPRREKRQRRQHCPTLPAGAHVARPCSQSPWREQTLLTRRWGLHIHRSLRPVFRSDFHKAVHLHRRQPACFQSQGDRRGRHVPTARGPQGMMQTGNHPPSPTPANRKQVLVPQPEQLGAWEQPFWPQFSFILYLRAEGPPQAAQW